MTAGADAVTVRWSDEANRPWSAEFSLDPKAALIRSIQVNGAAENILHLTVMLQDYADAPQISRALRDVFPDVDRAPPVKFINYRMPAHWRVQFHVTGVI